MQSTYSGLEGGIVFAGLLPHAPILIPEIGQQWLEAVAASAAAMRHLAAQLIGRRPEGVVVVSPHSPRRFASYGVWSGSRVHGSFQEFGFPGVRVDLPNDPPFAAELHLQAARVGVQTWHIPFSRLDHGALVPLWYLIQAGWTGPTTVLGLADFDEGSLPALGNILARAAGLLGRRTAVLASGDMSHRLTADAPGGYEPRAREFDLGFLAQLRCGTYRDIQKLDPELVRLAGQDVVGSTIVAAAAVNWEATGHEVLSYEGPLGVGYGVAVLFSAEIVAAPLPEGIAPVECNAIWGHVLPEIARESLKALVFNISEAAPTLGHPCLSVRRGVFVTLRSSDGQLRGCVGTVLPRAENIVEETRRLVREAAFCDSRFPAVSPEELPNLMIEVSVIGLVEEVVMEDQLDPERYGVVVSTSDGRHACLLPGLPEIRTGEEQLKMVCAKAGIRAGEPVRLQRFTAAKFPQSKANHAQAVGQESKRLAPDYPGRWWTMRNDGRIQCELCPRFCRLQEGQRGFCFVRQRLNSRMVLTAYGRTSGLWVDPIEKKPLNHFYPGTSVLSFGTAGCNLGCRFCQNWDISKARDFSRLADAATPETIAKAAQQLGCKAVAFTYNDPVIFAEYAIDVALACHAVGVQTVAVTAGYMTPEPREEFYQQMDAANVDLKGFSEPFYQKLCLGQLAPVLETLEYLHRETSVWLEVTSLLIPGENDEDVQLHWAADWFAEHLGPDVPWHFTAFHPEFKMLNTPRTPIRTLEKARRIARSKGLHYVYTGNVDDPAGNSTQCPQCKALLIERNRYELNSWNLLGNRCPTCHCSIAGRFTDQPGAAAGGRVRVRLESTDL